MCCLLEIFVYLLGSSNSPSPKTSCPSSKGSCPRDGSEHGIFILFSHYFPLVFIFKTDPGSNIPLHFERRASVLGEKLDALGKQDPFVQLEHVPFGEKLNALYTDFMLLSSLRVIVNLRPVLSGHEASPKVAFKPGINEEHDGEPSANKYCSRCACVVKSLEQCSAWKLGTEETIRRDF